MNIIHIADFDDSRLDIYARLTEAQLLNRREPAKGMFIAESPKVIERALDAGCEPVSILVEESRIRGEALQAMQSVEERLDTKYGIVLLNPAYTRYHLELGEITSYPPGYKENAGIFCHNNPWIVCAGMPTDSPRRFAARPVGAARTTRSRRRA